MCRAAAVVFDVEFTAWEGSMAARWLRPGEFKEIVQIGAVKVDAAFRPLARFDVLVRPAVNPVLAPYLEGIIGITNADIAARGVAFVQAYQMFMQFCEALPLVAYGRDDLVLEQNLRLNGICADVPPYTNIIGWMGTQGIDVRKGHGCDVGPKAGVPFEGHAHNALDDAASLAAGIAAVIARGAPSPLQSGTAAESAEEAGRLMALLALQPHPEGGAFREMFRDPAGTDGRAHSTAIYFLLRAGEVSARHRVDAAEVWHFYRGGPVELTIEEVGQPVRQVVLGPHIEAAEQPQVVVPACAWQSARPLGAYALVGCTVAPGFEFSRFEMG